MLEDNPIEGLKLENNYIITVSIEDSNEALEDIYNRITKLIEEDVDYTTHYLVIHFGVYSGSGKFRVETQGKNCNNFFIPDERGNLLKM